MAASPASRLVRISWFDFASAALIAALAKDLRGFIPEQRGFAPEVARSR